eukprot:1161050-Pelagomonas_calceolata.AAC.2
MEVWWQKSRVYTAANECYRKEAFMLESRQLGGYICREHAKNTFLGASGPSKNTLDNWLTHFWGGAPWGGVPLFA